MFGAFVCSPTTICYEAILDLRYCVAAIQYLNFSITSKTNGPRTVNKSFKHNNSMVMHIIKPELYFEELHIWNSLPLKHMFGAFVCSPTTICYEVILKFRYRAAAILDLPPRPPRGAPASAPSKI